MTKGFTGSICFLSPIQFENKNVFPFMYQLQLDRFKESFLSAAARGGRLDEVASLLDLASNEEEELDLRKPLMQALSGQHVEVVSLLLANGADPKLRSTEGNNALHIAAQSGNGDLCALLLSLEDSNEMIHALNDDGQTPFDISFEEGNFGLAQQFKNISDNIVDDLGQAEILSATSGDSEENEIRDRFLANLGNDAIYVADDSFPNASGFPNASEEEEIQCSQEHEIFDSVSVRDSETLQRQLDLMNSLQEENFSLKEEVRAGKTIVSNTEKALSILEQRISVKDKALKSADELINGSNLSKHSMEQLIEMENKLRHAMDMIARQKETLLESRLTEQEEKNLCVICQAETKTVLLLPCRHLCTCKECSERAELVNCPLCRTLITQKIDVFA